MRIACAPAFMHLIFILCKNYSGWDATEMKKYGVYKFDSDADHVTDTDTSVMIAFMEQVNIPVRARLHIREGRRWGIHPEIRVVLSGN